MRVEYRPRLAAAIVVFVLVYLSVMYMSTVMKTLGRMMSVTGVWLSMLFLA